MLYCVVEPKYSRKIETDLHAHKLNFDLGECAKNNYALYRLNKFNPFPCFLAKS